MRKQYDSRTFRLLGPPMRSRSAAVVLNVFVLATAAAWGQSGVGQLFDPAWMAQASPDAIRGLLQAGADLTGRGPDGETALHHALGNENVEVLKTLLEYGEDPNVANFAGQTALDVAAGRTDRREHALALARFGANHDRLAASVRSGLGLRSTFEALGEIPVERLLGSDWTESVSVDRLQALPAFRPDRDEESGLHTADLQVLFRRILATNRDPDVTSFLLNRGAQLEFPDGFHALHVAAGNANPEIAKSLLDREEAEVLIAQVDGSQRMALHYAAANENPDVVALLVAVGADVNAEDKDGLRALHYAAANENPDVADLLLDAGATLDAQDGDGRTALHIAAENPNPSVARLLLEAGADMDMEDASRRTPLDRSIDQGNSRVLRMFRAATDMSDAPISEAEQIIAIGEESRHVVAGVVGEVRQPVLDFYLRIALLNPDAGVAQFLLEKGAEARPVSLAALNPNPAVVALLLEHGVDPNAAAENMRGLRALHIAALNPNPSVAALLLEHGAKLNATDEGGRTALHLAAGNPNPAVTRHLLEAGAAPQTEDRRGERALHAAARNVNPAVAALLLEHGAKLNAADHDGRTALHLAAENPNPAVVAHLLEAGADVNALDAGQASPLTLSWSNPRSAVFAALLTAGATRMVLEDRLLDIEWLRAATATELVAQVANAMPSAFRRRDEECGRMPVHLITHFAARNNLDERLLELDSRLTAAALWRIDHRGKGFLAMLERGVSIQDTDGNGNNVLHYAVSGAAKVGPADGSQSFPSAGLGVLQDLRVLGADGRARGAADLLPIHYGQPGRAFTTDDNSVLARVLAEMFHEPGTDNPATDQIEDQFLPETDSCVVLGGSEEPTAPSDLTGN